MLAKKSFRLFVIFTILSLLLPYSTHSAQEVYLNISKNFYNKIRIAVPYFTPKSGSKEMKTNAARASLILSNDLVLSGYFISVKEHTFVAETEHLDTKTGRINYAEWKRIGADMVIKGTYSENNSDITVQVSVYSVSDGKKIFNKLYADSLSKKRRLMHHVSNDIVKAITGEQGIALSKITFAMESGKGREICSMDYDGYNIKKLTHDNSIALYPKWSPDGTKILYTSFKNNKPQIFIIDLAKNTRKVLSSSPGLNATATFAPNSTVIALTLSRDGNPEIYSKNLTTGKLKRLTHSRSIDTSPSWSPDGNNIVFVSNRSGSPQLYIMNKNGANLRRLTFRGGYNTAPAWSPKGDLIAYSSLIGRKFQIHTINSENGITSTITSNKIDNEDPSWAPDGRHIIYTSTKNHVPSINIVDIYDKNPIQLDKIPSNALNPNWSQ
ncbi:MAG: Tol-Pal system beta propeller repeat protein TolB [Candidatus Ancaeobacter aquaticus]|nr:Tol-Pal system beta propeller repeat protein TolB [Candidatus Ancaeobacter aquaticus]